LPSCHPSPRSIRTIAIQPFPPAPCLERFESSARCCLFAAVCFANNKYVTARAAQEKGSKPVYHASAARAPNPSMVSFAERRYPYRELRRPTLSGNSTTVLFHLLPRKLSSPRRVCSSAYRPPTQSSPPSVYVHFAYIRKGSKLSSHTLRNFPRSPLHGPALARQKCQQRVFFGSPEYSGTRSRALCAPYPT